MSNKKTLLLIAGVAIMLAGAASAYGYYEAWNGWFNSGSLTFLGSYPFEYTSGSGVLEDLTYGSLDTFFVSSVTLSTFTCSTTGPYLGYYIKLWPDASGWKYTGQSGQKPAHDGEWEGKAILYNPSHDSILGFIVWGTWESTSPHFNYATETYTADWEITDSNPDGLRGDGSSEGELQE